MFVRARQSIAGWIAPKSLTAVRRLDAASGSRRGAGFGTFHRIQPEVAAAAHVVRARARYLATSNPHISNAVGNWVAALVGCGIRPTGDAEAVSAWDTWNTAADLEGRTSFDGLQEIVARGLVVDGEAFLRFVYANDGLRLQVLPPELIDESKSSELLDGGYIVNGVEFNGAGQRVAYWIFPARPGDVGFAASVRVDASGVLHIMHPLAAGQVRGLSWLAPVVVPANELDGIIDALAVGVRVAALHAGFLTDENGAAGGENPFDGTQNGSILESGLEPGTLKFLPSGWKLQFNNPQQTQQVGEFLRFNLQILAAGLGVPEHYLSGDLSNANYSSLRAGLLPFRQRVEQIQYGTFVPQLLQPVWDRFHFLRVLSEGMGNPGRVEWLPPDWGQVDPLKDVQATVAELQAGLTSRRKAVAERGWDVAALDAEIAEDRDRANALGLAFGASIPNNKQDASSDED